MMRRSGVRPVVNRWKLACEMLRRAASGHIDATQLSKLAAASRIADAVINGWPEAPSSPLHGKAVLADPGTGCIGAAGVFGPAFISEPVKRFSRKLIGPPPADSARVSLHTSSTPRTIAALVRRFIIIAVLRIVPTRPCVQITDSGGPVAVSNRLTKVRFCC